MKYEIPIALRTVLEEVAKNNIDFCSKNFNEKSIILFKDLNAQTKFFFDIEKQDNQNLSDRGIYIIQYMPSNRNNFTPIRTSIPLAQIKIHFDIWKNIVLEYHNESILFDDPISQRYFDELEPEFEILDEDKEFAPYSIQQQKKIILFLEKVKIIITEHDPNSIDISETTVFIDETIKTISQSTKKKVIDRIRKIIAKGFKIGFEVGEKLLIEFTTELAKKLIMSSSS